MIERRVDGVAILTFGPDDSLIEVFRNRNVPVFSIGINSPDRCSKQCALITSTAFVRPCNLGGYGAHCVGQRTATFENCLDAENGLPSLHERDRLGHAPRTFTRRRSHHGSWHESYVGAGCFAKLPLGGVLLNDLTAISIMRQAFELSIMFRRNYLSSDSTTFNWRTS